MPPIPQEIKEVFAILEESHPLTMLEELSHYSPFQMLVMTLLSARTKDATTIPIVKEIFTKYPAPEDFAEMPLPKLEKLLYRIGFHRVKAKHVKQLSRIILDEYQGTVPDTFEELTSLPGVGRKTANCILAYTFKKPAIAVDVHVHRIANRLGWIKTKTPEESERALQEIIPKDEWINVNRLLVGHGQTICSPLRPHCVVCPVQQYCEYGQKNVRKISQKKS